MIRTLGIKISVYLLSHIFPNNTIFIIYIFVLTMLSPSYSYVIISNLICLIFCRIFFVEFWSDDV